MKRILYALVAGCAILLASCSDTQWHAKGRVEGGEGQVLLLEASHNGNWYAMDSVTLDGGESFDFAQTPVGYPDIYRLRLGDSSIYFPIDSLETVTVKTTAAGFASDYQLTGSARAEALCDIDRKIAAVVKSRGAEAAVTDSLLKRELSGMLLGDASGIVAYYIINKRVGEKPLFNPADKRDLRVIGAVANAFVQNRPHDPRTQYLSSLYLSSRKTAGSNPTDTLLVAEAPLVDFMLKDENGSPRSLSEIASHGNVVVLNFTIYSADRSPDYNRLLAALYDSYHDEGLDIVQVAIDDNQFEWVKSAKNLPWITLYAPEHERAKILMGYNVGNLPMAFVINRKGELVERVPDVTLLRGAISRHL